MFETKVSVWSQDSIDHEVRGTHFGCVYRRVRYFFMRCYFLLADLLCLIVWCVFFFFSSLEMVSYACAHVLYGSSIVQCVAIFFLLLIEFV